MAAGKENKKESQAVGKLFAERPGFAEGIVHTLSSIWCPRKGIKCRDLGDNLFLITFMQPGGKRRALEEGPWEFGVISLWCESLMADVG